MQEKSQGDISLEGEIRLLIYLQMPPSRRPRPPHRRANTHISQRGSFRRRKENSSNSGFTPIPYSLPHS